MNKSQYDLEKEEYELDHDTELTEYDLADDHVDDYEPSKEGTPEKTDEGENKRKGERTNRYSSFRLLFNLMVNPTEGWKNIRRAGQKPEKVARDCFYPLTALASAAVFIQYIYGTAESINNILITALTVFISFFMSYFLIMLLEKIVLPKSYSAVSESDYGRNYTMYLLSTLTLFYTLSCAVPMLDAVWVFLPIWTIFIASKGVRFFKFKDSRTTLLTCIISALIILSPIMLYLIFIELLTL